MKNIKQFIDQINDMPAMPNVIVKALNTIKKEDTGIKDLADVMSYDQALTTQVLKIVNSAYYGFSQQISSINKALPLLGMQQSKNIIIAVAMKPMLTAQGGKDLWKHSIRCAVGCELLAKEFKTMDENEAFVVGFLHDIGKMILNMKDPNTYKKVLEAKEKGIDVLEAEELSFGINHAELGALLTKKWELPLLLTNCVRYHHKPKASLMANVVYLVYAVDRMMQEQLPQPLFDETVWANSPLTIENPETYIEAIKMKSDLLLSNL